MIRPDIENLKNGKIITNNDDWTIKAPPAEPEVFDWIDYLEAENAQLLAECQQLKAHNRQLVGAIQTHGCIPSELAGYGCHLCDLVFNPPSFAKLALAEAEVLRAAERLDIDTVKKAVAGVIIVSLDINNRIQNELNDIIIAHQAMQEARGDA